MNILFSPAMERESLRQIKPETFFCDKNEKRDPGNRLQTLSRPPVSAHARGALVPRYCTNVSRGKLPPNSVVGRSHSPLALRTKECCRELRKYIQSSMNHIGRKGSNICSSVLLDKIWKYLFTSWCLKSKNM